VPALIAVIDDARNEPTISEFHGVFGEHLLGRGDQCIALEIAARLTSHVRLGRQQVLRL
jgi:hypothetical protein